MKAAVKEDTYQRLVDLFGAEFEMPPKEKFDKGDRTEYRCPYNPKCPTGAKCFIVATPEPLHRMDVLNVYCRLIGKKIPVYAGAAADRAPER